MRWGSGAGLAVVTRWARSRGLGPSRRDTATPPPWHSRPTGAGRPGGGGPLSRAANGDGAWSPGRGGRGTASRVAVVSRWRTWRAPPAPARRSGRGTVSFARLAGGAGAFPGAASGRVGLCGEGSVMLTPWAGPFCPAAVQVPGFSPCLGIRSLSAWYCLQAGVPGVGLNADVSQPSLAVSSGKMTYNRGPAWGWEHTPTLGDIRPAGQNELVEERRLFVLASECPRSALCRRMSGSCWISKAC